jgi:hypothetical protein
VLAPLTGLRSPLVKCKWGPEQQKAFDDIKKKVSQETLLAFPDFEKNSMCILMHPISNWEQSLYKKEKI